MKKIKLVFMALLSFTIFNTYAESSRTPTSTLISDLRTKALTESGAPSLQNKFEINTNIETLQLQDTYVDTYRNKSKWLLGLRLETYHPTGSAALTDSSTYNLSGIGQTYLPTVSVGLISSPFLLAKFLTNIGSEVMAGFSYQDVNLAAQTGTLLEGRFQTSTLSIRPFARFQWGSLPHLFTRIHGELGATQISMASPSSLARFSKSGSFLGYGLGLSWELQPSIDLLAEYIERRGLESSLNWSPSLSSMQVGVTYKW